MSANERPYRTLIAGTVVQRSGLSVGGSNWAVDHDDSCHRDGMNRLAIPGPSLAGALIETAARIFPGLVDPDDNARPLLRNLTSKEPGLPHRKGQEDECVRQSVWRFSNARPVCEVRTEWRQGVGIRQATGATAAEKGALYDFEFVPAGTCWSFFLEVDTNRGDPEAEAVAVLALNEWAHGRGWLGRSAARGTGWIKFEPGQLLRLTVTDQMLEIWPDNRKSLLAALAAVKGAGGLELTWEQAVDEGRQLVTKRQMSDAKAWRSGDWHYLCFPVTLGPGPATPVEPDGSAYGYDVLQVGGHPAGALTNSQAAPLTPLSVVSASDGTAADESTDWLADDYKLPDAPFVGTQPAGTDKEQPYLPGSGIRGPLRHTVSRLQRALGSAIRDPNWTGDPEIERLNDELDAFGEKHVPDSEVRRRVDDAAKLFGVEELCGRILVCDGMPTDETWQLSRIDHHAEDEFTAGVYASSKFDRNVLVKGSLRFHVIIEAPSLGQLATLVAPLYGALELARLGHLPIGGGKWRGAGWIPWNIGTISLHRAGSGQALAIDEETGKAVPARLDKVLNPSSRAISNQGSRDNA